MTQSDIFQEDMPKKHVLMICVPDSVSLPSLDMTGVRSCGLICQRDGSEDLPDHLESAIHVCHKIRCTQNTEAIGNTLTEASHPRLWVSSVSWRM